MPDQEPTTETSQPSEQVESQNDVKEVSQAQPQEQQEETPVVPTEGSKKKLDPAPEPEHITDTDPESKDMPDYLEGMDKFYNKEKGLVEIEKLANSYRSLEGKLGQRKEELTKELQQEITQEEDKLVPGSSDKYELNLSEEYDEVKHKMQESKVWEHFRETAFDNKLSQTEVDSMVDMYLTAQKKEAPDIEEEMRILGDNASSRVEAVELWSKKNLDENAFNAISYLCTTANGIQAMEQIMTATAQPSVGDLQGATVSSLASEADLKSLMADPRYSDPNKRDIAYINYVTEQFKKKYGEEPADGGSAGKLG